MSRVQPGRAGAVQTAVSIARKTHFSLGSVGYALLTVMLGLGAVNSQNNLLFWTFGMAVAVMVVSGVLSGSMLMGIRARRVSVGAWAGVAQVGEPLTITYEIENERRAVPAFALSIVEAAPRVPRSRRRRGALPWEGRIGGARAFLAHVRQRSSATAEAQALPRRRGVIELGELIVESSFPFGLLRKSLHFALERPDRVLVRPAVHPVRPGLLREAATVAGEGESLVDALGRSEEFFGLREYSPGDSLRSIAWRPTARTGTLVIRETAARSLARLWVIVLPRENPAADEREDPLAETMYSMAASLVVEAGRERLEVGLIVASRSEPAVIQPRGGPGHIADLLDALALAPSGGGDLGVAAEALGRAGRAPAAAALIVAGEPPDRSPGPLRGARRFSALRPEEILLRRGGAKESAP